MAQSTHSNDGEYYRLGLGPCNDYIFDIRKNYKTVFPEFLEDEFEPIDKEDVSMKSLDSSKVYKIKYSINLLPLIRIHIDIKFDENGNF